MNDKNRICSRGIIIKDNKVHLMFRRKTNELNEVREYYVIPGGGIQLGETKEEAVIRELKEELSVDVKINKYLGQVESTHFFCCEILSGIVCLGGEEKENNSKENYYEIVTIPLNEIDNYYIYFKEMILEAFNSKKSE